MKLNVLKIWRDDVHVILLVINVLLIVIGYGLAGFTGMASNIIMLPLKTLVLVFSFIHILNDAKSITYRYSVLVFFFVFLIFLFACFSSDIFRTISRSFPFIFPFVYLYLSLSYMLTKYSQESVIRFFVYLFNVIYSLPILSFYFLGGSFALNDIYGEVIGGFVSNHLGWSSLLFLLTSYDLYSNKILKGKYLGYVLLLLLPSVYLLFISGNRASYLSFIIVFLVFAVRNNQINILFKGMVIALSFYLISSQLDDKDSALSKRLHKTELQMEDSEENKDTRATARKIGFNVMEENPMTYITGLGLFSFRESVKYYMPSVNSELVRSGVHNSYLELYFGSGIIVFFIFFIFFIIKPIFNYLIYYSDRFTFVLPFFIIPFFESNLGGGQFLFYP